MDVLEYVLLWVSFGIPVVFGFVLVWSLMRETHHYRHELKHHHKNDDQSHSAHHH